MIFHLKPSNIMQIMSLRIGAPIEYLPDDDFTLDERITNAIDNAIELVRRTGILTMVYGGQTEQTSEARLAEHKRTKLDRLKGFRATTQVYHICNTYDVELIKQFKNAERYLIRKLATDATLGTLCTNRPRDRPWSTAGNGTKYNVGDRASLYICYNAQE